MIAGENRKPAWLFYPAWVIVSAISLPIAWVIAWAIMAQVVKAVGDTIQVGGQSHITEDFLFIYFILPVLGLVAGLLQYLLLRRYLPRMAWWVAATALGWSLLSALMGVVTFSAGVVPPAVVIALIGVATGVPQWLVLRRRVPRAALWILASVLGWGIAFLPLGSSASQAGALTVALLPSIAASIAWWLLLDKLPQRERSGGNAPRDTSAPIGVR
ncbi:MAG: hypothetical protein HZB53_05625 [Chloroflexi bacterium]|nr:hypothetical protein [Chloroflexota bacterium]